LGKILINVEYMITSILEVFSWYIFSPPLTTCQLHPVSYGEDIVSYRIDRRLFVR